MRSCALSWRKKLNCIDMRSRFISMVSHEFRRPLTTITTSIDLLEHYRNRMTDEAAQKHFTRIHEQLGEMNELLDDFLALMRAEAQEQDFKPVACRSDRTCAASWSRSSSCCRSQRNMRSTLRQSCEQRRRSTATKSCCATRLATC